MPSHKDQPAPPLTISRNSVPTGVETPGADSRAGSTEAARGVMNQKPANSHGAMPNTLGQ
ncbi:hypothetical protein KEM55_005016, partial [Ascosphaera atra]